MKIKSSKEYFHWIRKKARQRWEVGKRSEGDFLKRYNLKPEYRGLSFDELCLRLGEAKVICRLIPPEESIKFLNGGSFLRPQIEIDLSFPDNVLLHDFKENLRTCRGMIAMTASGKILRVPSANKKEAHFDKRCRTYEMIIKGMNPREVAKALHPKMKLQSAMRTVRRDMKEFLKMIETKRGHMQ